MSNPENPDAESPIPSNEAMFQTPEYLANLAFLGLDRVVTDWMSQHPTVTAEEVERARELFDAAIEYRRQSETPQG